MWGVSTLFQAAPGASGASKPFALNNKCARQSLEPGARLKFHAGWSGWTRPPTMAGGGGGVWPGVGRVCLRLGCLDELVLYRSSIGGTAISATSKRPHNCIANHLSPCSAARRTSLGILIWPEKSWVAKGSLRKTVFPQGCLHEGSFSKQ